jgi:large subunit ribosomal protein L21
MSASLKDRRNYLMYAVIATGGKQYKVEEGDIIRVEKLNAENGAEVTFDNVIAIMNDGGIIVGDQVASANVKATVVKTAKAKKVTVYKYKPKTGYHKKNGHRQPFTEVKIEAINA